MTLTKNDISAIGNLITQSEERTGKKIDSVEGRLLDAIHDVGVEVTQTKSALLQHIGNERHWKH